MFKFFDDERGRAFAHDETIAQQIERPASEGRIARPLAHRFDDRKRVEGESGQWRFRAAGNNYIGKIVADVTQRFADGNGAAGATVRVRRADAAKSKFNRDVRMGRAAENLDGQHRIHSARALFQKTNVLIFRLANAAECGAETYAEPMLRLFARIGDPGVIERQLRRSDGKLRVTIEPLQTMAAEKIPPGSNREISPPQCALGNAPVSKARNPADAAFLRANAIPKTIDAFADAGDGTDACDDGAPSGHAVTLFARASTYSFIQRKVLLATL